MSKEVHRSTHFLLAEDYDKTRYELELPLTSRIDYDQVRKELHVPEYVDASDFLLERGLVAIWAATKAPSLHELDQSVKNIKQAIPVLFFGSAAIKLLCAEANSSTSSLYRQIGDIDLITSRKRGKDLYKILVALGNLCGTRYYHFVTGTDQRFNAARRGQRYRVRAIDEIVDGKPLKVGLVDVFVDEIDLRHKIEVGTALANPEQQGYTIGSANVLLTKCQYIFDVPKAFQEDIVRQSLEHRILNYPPYRSDRLLVGMEEKDIKDVCALFMTHEPGESADCISIATIRRVLNRDKKFALTVRLNLENLLANEAFLEKLGLTHPDIEKIFSRVRSTLESVPTVDKRWSDPWWNLDVETPQIFGKDRL